MLGGLSVAAAACAPAQQTPASLYRIYSGDPAHASVQLQTLVALPGILGSQIIDPTDGDRMYWGAALGSAPKPTKRPEDARKLALPMRLGAPISELDDELVAGAVLTTVEVELATGPIQVRAYPGVFHGLVSHLIQHRAIEHGKVATDAQQLADMHWSTPFQGVGYDWRRDLASQTVSLDARVRAAAKARAEAGGGERTDLVAHSMGCLLARYYLRYGTQPLPADGSLPELTWAGAEHLEQVVLVGPPNSGSPIVFENLIHGRELASALPVYPPALLGTFPGLYQLLPRTRHHTVVFADDLSPVDLYDISVWRRYGWGLLSESSDEMLTWLLPELDDRAARLEVADEHLRKSLALAEQFHRALDVPATPPEHVQIHLFASDDRPTRSRFVVDRETGEVTLDATAPGDGSVTRASALADERQGPVERPAGRLRSPIAWSSAHWGEGEHLELTGDVTFIDDLLFLLLEAPRP